MCGEQIVGELLVHDFVLLGQLCAFDAFVGLSVFGGFCRLLSEFVGFCRELVIFNVWRSLLFVVFAFALAVVAVVAVVNC